jgi:hypothetical protein
MNSTIIWFAKISNGGDPDTKIIVIDNNELRPALNSSYPRGYTSFVIFVACVNGESIYPFLHECELFYPLHPWVRSYPFQLP